ncbi:unnamed protein product, partial [marine sediment metagenome]
AFFDAFEDKLESELLSDRFYIKSIVPRTKRESIGALHETEESYRIVDQCVNKVTKIMQQQEVAVILVDIVILELKRAPLDVTGIYVARALRQKFPDALIYAITGHVLESEIWVLSEASLEDVDGVMAKQYLTGQFSAKSLQAMLAKGEEKRATRRAAYRIFSLDNVELHKLRSSFSIVDMRIQNQIQEISQPVFYSLLSQLFPNGQGIISYVRPGFSGAFLFKVCVKIKPRGRSPTKPKWWIIKVDRNLKKIQKEFHEYSQVKLTPLAREYYPSVLSRLASCGSWGAIAIE